MSTKTVIILIVSALAVTAVIYLISKCKHDQPDVIAAVDSVQFYKNKLGQEIAAIKQREADYHKAEAGYLDSIAGLHNTKQKLIQEIAVLTQKGTVYIPVPGKPTIVYKDTGSARLIEIPCGINYVEQTFKNPWYNASVQISLSGDSSRLNLETFDTLRYVVKEVKEGNIFNRRTYLQVDAVNTNPYNKIQGLSVYRKPLPKPKKIGIGIQGGYGFSNSFKPAPYIGVGIQYSIIRL